MVRAYGRIMVSRMGVLGACIRVYFGVSYGHTDLQIWAFYLQATDLRACMLTFYCHVPNIRTYIHVVYCISVVHISGICLTLFQNCPALITAASE